MDAHLNLEDFQFFDPRSDVEKSENRLPHWAQTGAVHFVTFRLGDAIPRELLIQWEEERNAWLKHHPEPWSAATTREYHERFSGEIERWLDAGHGSCLLRDGSCAELVGEALRFFDGLRCRQISWVVMPNHVHALFALIEPWKLERLIQSWKRHSARQINLRCGVEGTLWQKDYFDRMMRDRGHLANCVRYIRRNPAKACLREGESLLLESELAQSIA